MANLKLILQCLFSPRLLKVYSETPVEGYFDAGSLDRLGDQIITSLTMAFNVCIYSSPIFATVLYKKGYFAYEGLFTLAKFFSGFGLVVAASLILRGIGRSNNPTYVAFLQSLKAAQNDLNNDTKRALMKYDFEFWAWPVDYKWNLHSSGKKALLGNQTSSRRTGVGSVLAAPCEVVAYLVAHTIGVRLVYPGSIALLRYVMGPVLLKGRVQLVNEEGGERFKLQTVDNNDIDTFFVDRRPTRSHNSSTLVICSEGNAGFYEIGIMVTPLQTDYSVLGWNHPGFGGSTGMPYMSEEKNAMDVVMQFAIEKLGFLPENIILFGWSIGGYSSSWAAMSYPDVRHVVLDATFDDVVALAVLRMPGALEPIVKKTIRSYINLNNYELLSKYQGPISLIRRTDDEVLCTEDMNMATNRGNNLLVKLLQYRYPKLIDEKSIIVLDQWLAANVNQRTKLWSQYGVDEGLCSATLASYMDEHLNIYPMLIGEDMPGDIKAQLTLFLASKYMTDYRSSHCTPLPVSYFTQQIPDKLDRHWPVRSNQNN